MAGHTISIYFKEAGHDVTAFSRSKVVFELIAFCTIPILLANSF